MSKTRKWLRILHRDLGYLFVGLTLIYAVSGIALNHIDDWNPNYVIEKKEMPLGNLKEDLPDAEIVNYVLGLTGIKGDDLRSSFRPAPGKMQIFTEQGEILLDFKEKLLIRETTEKRAVFYDVNFLHLDKSKDFWIWISDIFALILIFLAVSGLFLIKGKKGFKWRGAILSAIGLLLPVLLMIFYRFTK